MDKQTGQLNVSTKFTKWNSSCNFIFELIAFTKQAFEFDNIEELKSIANIVNDQLFHCNNEQLKNAINETMNDFNDRVINKKVNDRNYIDFTDPDSPAIIEKVRKKLLNEKYSLDTSLDYSELNGNNMGPRKSNCSTSISGLSWTKRIIFN